MSSQISDLLKITAIQFLHKKHVVSKGGGPNGRLDGHFSEKIYCQGHWPCVIVRIAGEKIARHKRGGGNATWLLRKLKLYLILSFNKNDFEK